MRLVTYSTASSGPSPRLGVRVGHRVLDVESASRVDGEPIPSTLRGLLKEGRGAFSRVHALAKAARTSAGRFSSAMVEEGAIRWWPPLPEAERLLRVDGEAGSWSMIDAAGLAGQNARVSVSGNGLRCEPRLAFVVARSTGGFSPDMDPLDYVAGITLLVGLEAEGADGVVIGPELVTLDEAGDPEELWLSCSVNGDVVMRGSPREALASIARALAGSHEPAEPGDLLVVPCGGSAPLRPGDAVECVLEGITALRATLA